MLKTRNSLQHISNILYILRELLQNIVSMGTMCTHVLMRKPFQEKEQVQGGEKFALLLHAKVL